MKILFDNKWFIGTVDFYDFNKQYGFVATSGTKIYYVDATLFADIFQFSNSKDEK